MVQVIALIHHEDDTFGVSFPDFPGCVSTGQSADEGLARARQALALHLEGMIEDGQPMPALRTIDDIRADPALRADLDGALLALVNAELPGRAVRVNITLDEHLLAAVDRAARATGATRSGFLAEAARARIAGSRRG